MQPMQSSTTHIVGVGALKGLCSTFEPSMADFAVEGSDECTFWTLLKMNGGAN